MKLRTVLIPVGLILAMAISRFLPHPPNFTPVMSVALFGSAVLLNRYLGIVLAIAAMAVSDLFFGWHSTLPYVYAAMVAVGFLGFLLRSDRSPLKILAVSLTGSVLFFVVTNLGVFFSQDLYPRTFQGLGACFMMAIPFFKSSVAGDTLFTGMLFALHYYLNRQVVTEQQPKTV
jgi:general stress protein CsbA